MYRIFTYTFTFETTQRWYMRYVGNNPSFAPLIWLIFLESQNGRIHSSSYASWPTPARPRSFLTATEEITERQEDKATDFLSLMGQVFLGESAETNNAHAHSMSWNIWAGKGLVRCEGGQIRTLLIRAV